MLTKNFEEGSAASPAAPTPDELREIFSIPQEEKKNEELSQAKQLEKDLQNQFENLYDVYDQDALQSAFSLAEDYKSFLDQAKTEREAVKVSVSLLQNLGFADISAQESLQPGDKVYKSVHGKGLMAAVIGQAGNEKGYAILGAHIDSPRLDLKPKPVYQDGDMVFFKTHYYGGIKKYQWTTIPLALHGFAVRKDGTEVEISIGENEDEPVFMLTDLLIHLSAEQMQKKASKVIEGEELNLLVSGRPLPQKEISERFKLGLLLILKEQYGLTERDLISAEIEIVPAAKARDLGFDRSFISGYGHDDRVCAYPAIRAIASEEDTERTVMLMLTDKEEVGSTGNTGAISQLYDNFMAEVYSKTEGAYDELGYRKTLEKSCMLSADVINGYDPTFPSTVDIKNTNYMGRGVSLQKYTGSGGKGGASDASSEFFSKVIHLLDEHEIPWQTGELGKIDLGGGGTISHYMAVRGMQVLDCGVPVLNMHAPQEIIHKLDLYATYQTYKTFIENI